MAEAEPVRLKIVVPPAPWTGAMADDSVQIPGVGWDCSSAIDHAPDRFIATKELDVGENGLRRLALDVLAGAPPLGIPVFFGREHMQRNIIVRTGSGIAHPKDLAGKKVGSRLTIVSGTMAGIMLMLEQGYGVKLADVIWHCGGPTSKLPANPLGLALKPGPETDEENFKLLLGGELDAVVVTTGPRYWSLFGGAREDEALARFPGLRPLIQDAETIARVYRRTGLYPITDTGVVSANLLKGDPALPRKLVEAFSRANDLASKYRSAEEEQLARRELHILGEDPHRYGLGENQRKNIAAFLDLLARMGALPVSIDPERLFVPSTLRHGPRPLAVGPCSGSS